jgi:hypothetical protein
MAAEHFITPWFFQGLQSQGDDGWQLASHSRSLR